MERKILIIVVFGILSLVGFSLAQEQTKMSPPEMRVAPTPVPVSIPVPILSSETKLQPVSPSPIETKPIEIELKKID